MNTSTPFNRNLVLVMLGQKWKKFGHPSRCEMLNGEKNTKKIALFFISAPFFIGRAPIVHVF